MSDEPVAWLTAKPISVGEAVAYHQGRAMAIAEAARVGRDLYKGDGSRLNSYDEGWNDGIDAAEQAIRALSPAPSVTHQWIEDRAAEAFKSGFNEPVSAAIFATLAALGVEVKS